MGELIRGNRGTSYTNIVHHHLVQANGTQGTLDDISNGNGSKHCRWGRVEGMGMGMDGLGEEGGVCDHQPTLNTVPFWFLTSAPEIRVPPIASADGDIVGILYCGLDWIGLDLYD